MTVLVPTPEPGEPDPLDPFPDEPTVPEPPVRTPGPPEDPRPVPDHPAPIPSPGPISGDDDGVRHSSPDEHADGTPDEDESTPEQPIVQRAGVPLSEGEETPAGPAPSETHRQ